MAESSYRRYYQKNLEKMRARGRRYYRENREAMLAYHRRYYQENREKCKALTRRWREENPEKEAATQRRYKQKHKERYAAHSARWDRENPLSMKIRKIRAQARKQGLPCTVTYAQAKEIWGTGRCFYCGEPATGFDHVVPLAAGGGATRGNLVAACRRCNVWKEADPLEEVLSQLLLPV